jgi:hypothetical protein
LSGEIPTRSAAVKWRRSDPGGMCRAIVLVRRRREVSFRRKRATVSRQVVCSGRQNVPQKRRFVDTSGSSPYNEPVSTEAKFLGVNAFGARSLPAPQAGQGLGSAPDPGPVAVQEEQEWMTS